MARSAHDPVQPEDQRDTVPIVKRRFAVLLAASVVLAACGGDGDDDASDPSTVEGEWVAVSGVSEGDEIDLIDGFAVTIEFSDGAVEGQGSCNRYSGEADVGDDGSIAVSDLSWTEIGCEPDVQMVENAYLASLARVDSFSTDDDVLTLSSDVDEWTFERAG